MFYVDILNAEMQTFNPGTYLMRLKRNSGQKQKSQDTTTMILEGLFSEDVLIANANQELDFRFFNKNS